MAYHPEMNRQRGESFAAWQARKQAIIAALPPKQPRQKRAKRERDYMDDYFRYHEQQLDALGG